MNSLFRRTASIAPSAASKRTLAAFVSSEPLRSPFLFRLEPFSSTLAAGKLEFRDAEMFPVKKGIVRGVVSDISKKGVTKPQIFGIVWGRSPLRCMTTMGHQEASSGHESYAASPEIVQPQRIKFKRPDKTARHIMNILDKEAVENVRKEREILDIRPGYIIQLKVEVPENKRRVSTIKGIVIARRNAGLHTTFRLRRLVAGVGIESVFPLYSPNIKEVKVLDKKEVRRAKLYYLRERMNPLKK